MAARLLLLAVLIWDCSALLLGAGTPQHLVVRDTVTRRGATVQMDLFSLVSDPGLLVKGGLDELKGSLDELNIAFAVVGAGVFASWWDLKQGVVGLLTEGTEQQERALSPGSTELKLDVKRNNAVIELSVPKRLRGFEEKSFTLRSQDGGKTLSLLFSHERVVQTWQMHLPNTKIVEPEEHKNGLSYTFTKEETAISSPRAKCRIELTRPLVPRPWR